MHTIIPALLKKDGKEHLLKEAYLRSLIYRQVFSDFATLSAAGGDFEEGLGYIRRAIDRSVNNPVWDDVRRPAPWDEPRNFAGHRPRIKDRCPVSGNISSGVGTYAIEEGLSGHQSRGAVGEPGVHAVSTRLRAVSSGTRSSTYGPTPTHRRSLEIIEQEFGVLRGRLNTVLEERLPALERQLEAAGAPWTPGQPVPPVG